VGFETWRWAGPYHEKDIFRCSASKEKGTKEPQAGLGGGSIDFSEGRGRRVLKKKKVGHRR